MLGTEVLLINTDVLNDALSRHAELVSLAKDASARTQLIAYEWLMRDAMDASRRTAHFLCEHAIRRDGEHSDSIRLELTQQQIGEVTAQTSVNVNRMLRSLEREGLFVSIGDRQYRADWGELRRLGHFDAGYLGRG
jgi:CRP-like cAMP-binding protein